MKFSLIVLALTCGFAASADTVKMKKAIKEGDEAITEQKDAFNKACGGKIKVSSKHKDASTMKVDQSDPENNVVMAGKRCGDVLYAMAQLCSDADYKAEMAKITELKCAPKAFEKKPYWVFEKKGTVLNVSTHPASDGSSEGIEALKNML